MGPIYLVDSETMLVHVVGVSSVVWISFSHLSFLFFFFMSPLSGSQSSIDYENNKSKEEIHKTLS